MAESSVAAQCEARLGRSLRGKWTLERLLGVGGMAAVYVGVHKIGRKDAIKILHPDVARSKELNLRFEQEARAVNRFAHPGAVEIRDIDVSEDGCPFLVMELLEGENLGERAARFGGIPTDELLRYVDELLDVLAAAHAQGIVHRDIKLDNLFVTTDGKLKVLDFGIARVKAGPAITMIGTRLGTTAYMAPEQVQGREIDARADVFAVGATMFRLLAKRRIHEAATDVELVTKMASMPAPPIASVVDGIEPGLALVVDRALKFEANDRYPNALTMQGDIRALREGTSPPFATARAAAGPSVTPAIAVATSAAAAFASEPTGAAFAPEATAAATPGGMRAATASLQAREPTSATSAGPVSLPGPPMSTVHAPQSLHSSSMAVAVSVAPMSPSPASPSAMGGPPSMGAPASMRGPVSMSASYSGYGSPAGSAGPVAFAAPTNVPVIAMPGRAPTKSGSTGLVIAAVALVGLLAIGAGGYLFFAASSSASTSEESDEETSEGTHAKKKKPAAEATATATATATASPTATATAAPTAPAEAPAPTAQASATGAVVETWPSSPGGGGAPAKPTATTTTTSKTTSGGGLTPPPPTPIAASKPTATSSGKPKPGGASHPDKPKR
jgi:serine/threonine-protein kinase